MAELGINVAGRAEQSPASIANLGARWVRCVAYPDVNITPWIQGCHNLGLRVLLVLARESIGDDTQHRLELFEQRYHDLADAWQVGNEPDHVSPSSWTMAPRDLSNLLHLARSALGPDAYLVGAGLVSGHPSWAADVDWHPVNALACHPYAKEPHTAPLDALLSGYARYGRPLWVTEYHARTIGMAAALRDDPRLKVALAFCMSDSMVPGFGLIEDRAALEDFKAATATGGQPVPDPVYVLGFKQIADRHPDIVGLPRENESGPWRNCSAQFTTKGLLIWGNFVASGDQKGFIANDLTRYVWEQDHLRRVS